MACWCNGFGIKLKLVPVTQSVQKFCCSSVFVHYFSSLKYVILHTAQNTQAKAESGGDFGI